MLGVFGGRQLAQPVETRLLARRHVEQPGQCGGQRGGLAGQQRGPSLAALQPSTSRVSSSRRRSSGIAGGIASVASA